MSNGRFPDRAPDSDGDPIPSLMRSFERTSSTDAAARYRHAEIYAIRSSSRKQVKFLMQTSGDWLARRSRFERSALLMRRQTAIDRQLRDALPSGWPESNPPSTTLWGGQLSPRSPVAWIRHV